MPRQVVCLSLVMLVFLRLLLVVSRVGLSYETKQTSYPGLCLGRDVKKPHAISLTITKV